MTRQEKNYRLFCYFNARRYNDPNGKVCRTVISIKTLEQYCEVPTYTIQHLINLRRLISDRFVDVVSDKLKDQFGYNPERILTEEEESEMSLYNLFN